MFFYLQVYILIFQIYIPYPPIRPPWVGNAQMKDTQGQAFHYRYARKLTFLRCGRLVNTQNTTCLDLRKLSYLRRRENSKANVCGNSYIDKAALSWNSARNLRLVFFNKSFVRAWRMWLQVARCAGKCKKTALNHLVGWKCENLFPLLLLCIPQMTFTHIYIYIYIYK